MTEQPKGQCVRVTLNASAAPRRHKFDLWPAGGESVHGLYRKVMDGLHAARAKSELFYELPDAYQAVNIECVESVEVIRSTQTSAKP